MPKYPIGASKDGDILNAIHDTNASLTFLIDSMYRKAPGCTCDGRGLCAFHAQVAEYIRQAQKELNKATAYMLKEQ